MNRKTKIIISGGGTGGHIFPALSIADALRAEDPSVDILFVGAIGKMEMEKVPAAGYPIKGLPVAGLQRSLSPKNLALPFKVLRSLRLAGKILREFRPDVVVGVGGFASAPLLWSASRRGIPTLIQEQNSFAGLTNRIVGRRAHLICTAYEGMEKFFPPERILLTGNPIRAAINPPTPELRAEGIAFYGLDPDKKTLFVVGGSLGCRSLNRTVQRWILEEAARDDFQVIWQHGTYYKAESEAFIAEHPAGNVRHFDFIRRMDLAYAAADVIVSRAGAGTISELCVVGKATIFVPSPNVAEDHQTHNAMALVARDAALMVRDADAPETLMGTVRALLSDAPRRETLERNIRALGRKDAAQVIAREVLKLVKH